MNAFVIVFYAEFWHEFPGLVEECEALVKDRVIQVVLFPLAVDLPVVYHSQEAKAALINIELKVQFCTEVFLASCYLETYGNICTFSLWYTIYKAMLDQYFILSGNFITQ